VDDATKLRQLDLNPELARMIDRRDHETHRLDDRNRPSGHRIRLSVAAFEVHRHRLAIEPDIYAAELLERLDREIQQNSETGDVSFVDGMEPDEPKP
jgi:hypothetical protein